MKCPHCTINFHANWSQSAIMHGGVNTHWYQQNTQCPDCKKWIIALKRDDTSIWIQVNPRGSTRGPTPQKVPAEIAVDYAEAAEVLPISAKASAALARRCLQNILHAHGYVGRDLAKEIDLLLNEADPKKGIPESLRLTIDGIRNFGNFSAHPITDKTSLQIIDVEDHEAEWCLDTLDEMFEHFYVRPAQARTRKAALDAKLQAAGKPASK